MDTQYHYLHLFDIKALCPRMAEVYRTHTKWCAYSNVNIYKLVLGWRET